MPFKPGQSGNPGGRQKEKPFRDALRLEIAALQAEDDPKGLRAVARKLISVANSGDVGAIRELADRLDGKVPQAIGTDDDLGPVKHEISWNPKPSSGS